MVRTRLPLTRPERPRAREAARRAGVGLGALAVAGTGLSFFRSPHWIFRMWDFPRLQVAGAALLAGFLFAPSFSANRWRDLAFVASLGMSVVIQTRRVAVYTPLWPVQVERSRRSGQHSATIRLLVNNVERENPATDRVLAAVREHEPDVFVALEVDSRWERALEPLAQDYPYVVRQPQENHFGMMLYSRLPLEDTRTEFLVQHDIPSIHTTLVLRNGERVDLHALHPRPPEPYRDQGSAPRDAELVRVGRQIGRGDPERPTIVAGDLNDVAWSDTTRLFLRLSKLLDPRIGRGFYNSYHARNPLFRWSLDHLFHSDHFRVLELRRLDPVGSDHFPMLATLSYEPDARRSQDEPEADARDLDEARERLEDQRELARDGEDRPDGE